MSVSTFMQKKTQSKSRKRRLRRKKHRDKIYAEWNAIIGDRTTEIMKKETIKFDLDKKNSNANKRLKYIQTLFASFNHRRGRRSDNDDENACKIQLTDDDKKADDESFFKPIDNVLDISNGYSKEIGDTKCIYEISSEANVSLGCNFNVTSNGKWYYEVELIEDPNTYKNLNIGFANNLHSSRNEVGFDVNSYGYNGIKSKIFNMNTNYGISKWKIGDIVGCALNGNTIEFYLNGVSQGIAFDNVEYIGNLYAGFTLQRGQFGTFIFDENKLKQTKPDGYNCIHVDTQADMDDMWTNGDITCEKVDNGIKITANSGCFPTAIFEHALSKDNKYYFEFELGTEGCMQLGFVDEEFEGNDACGEGIGDDEHSWGCDFLRMLRWGVFGNEYGNVNWTNGDIIGCLLDFDNKCISYSLNGKSLDVAFEDIDCDQQLFPCISVRNSERKNEMTQLYQMKRAGVEDDELKSPEPIVYFNLIFCDKGYKYKPNGYKAMTENIAFRVKHICNGLRQYSYEQYNADYGYMDSVYMLTNDEEFDDISNKVGGRLIVCDFWATWCGPCVYIAPHYHEISQQFPDVVFLKADVDKLKKLSEENNIRCMPTFKFFKNGKEIHTIYGGDKDGIIEAVKKYS